MVYLLRETIAYFLDSDTESKKAQYTLSVFTVSFSDKMLLVQGLVWLAAAKSCATAQKVHGDTV